MVDIKLEHDYPVAADALWRIVADFTDMSWAGMGNMEIDGTGIGMLRKVELGMPEPVLEQLLTLDNEQMPFSYAIVAGNPLPTSDYQAGARVLVIDDKNCRLEWWCRCRVEGMSDADVAAILSDSYTGLLESLAGHLSV